MADAKYISLQWDASKEIHAEADEMKLSLAISNLVDNAVKYTPGGRNRKGFFRCRPSKRIYQRGRYGHWDSGG